MPLSEQNQLICPQGGSASEAHVRTQNVFNCLICRRYCQNRKHIEVDKLIKDRKNPNFPCLICKFEYRSAEEWKQHNQSKCTGKSGSRGLWKIAGFIYQFPRFLSDR